jgi:RNA polymerase primary sigma factor
MNNMETKNNWEKFYSKVSGNDVVFVSEIFALLPERYREILEFRYGLVDGVFKTLEETGKNFGITKERVRQVEERSVELIRDIKRTKK